MGELKPCPFCGEIPKIEDYPYASLIACRNKNCDIKPRVGESHAFGDFVKAHLFLVATWNRRSGDV